MTPNRVDKTFYLVVTKDMKKLIVIWQRPYIKILKIGVHLSA